MIENRSAGTPVESPLADARIVDAEVQVAVVGLTAGDAGMMLDGEVEAAPCRRIKLREQVAESVVEDPGRIHPKRDGEVFAAEVERVAVAHLDVGTSSIEASLFGPEVDSVVFAMVVPSG